MKCRSMHTYFWMSFPFASPCSLKGEIRAEVTGDRFNFVQAGIKRQPSLAAAYSACTGVVAGATSIELCIPQLNRLRGSCWLAVLLSDFSLMTGASAASA